jgi:hypothetical protein
MARTPTILNDPEGPGRRRVRVPAAQTPWVEAMRRRSTPHGRRRVPLPTGPGELAETSYMASGGLSSLIQLDDEELQVEIHRQSFSLLWSTDLLADSTIRNVRSLLPGVPLEAEIAYVDGMAIDQDPFATMETITRGDDARQIAYVRLQFEDRVVSWEQRRVHLLGSSRWFVSGQVGFVADQLDQAYVELMIERTASRRLAPIAAELARRVANTVEAAGRFPLRAFEDAGGASAAGGAS